jgi:hypothetical protein
MDQCHELKIASPEAQAIFLFYMIIKLIREEGYIDENSLRQILNRYKNDPDRDKLSVKLNTIYKQILRDGYLTIEQVIHSARDFFLQDVSHYFIYEEYFIYFNLVSQ